MSNNSKYFKVGDKVKIDVYAYDVIDEKTHVQFKNKICKITNTRMFKDRLGKRQEIMLNHPNLPFEYYYNDQLIPVIEDSERVCRNKK